MFIKKFKELNGKCVISCQAPNLYLNENNECSQNCASGFYNPNDENKCVSESSSSNCYYAEDEVSFPKKCYSSCSAISSQYIYEKNGKVCSKEECDYHTNNGIIKKCYDSLNDCKNDGYKYFSGKIIKFFINI